jgi:hypothetical protein
MGTSEAASRKWEWWSDGRRRRRTICVTMADNDLTIALRAVGTDGRMSTTNALLCDVAHLPKLIRVLTRALAVARSHRQIDRSGHER